MGTQSGSPKQLTPVEAQAMADDSRAMAKIVASDSHRLMLIAIPETWERIAKETKWKQ